MTLTQTIPTKARRSAGGFTLLEVILAVSVTAVVSAALFTTMSGVFKARRHAEDHLAGRESARALINIIRDDLQCVPPAGGRVSGVFMGEDGSGMNRGSADALTYVTANAKLKSTQDLADLRRVELRLLQSNEDPDHYVLVRLVTGNLLANITPEPEMQVLARRVVSFNVQYFNGNEWLDEWDSIQLRNAIPVAVEVVLITAPELSNQPENEDEREANYITTSQIIRLPAAEPAPEGGLNLQRF